jgi:Holliday junction DNA helicase RuvA
LEGTLLERQGPRLTINVGGVGYGVTATAGAADAAGQPGDRARLWIRTYVREDALRLFGFARSAEREAFDLLMGVPGVGPVICLAMLSELSLGELVQAVSIGDAKRLTVVKGVGNKVAEKILLELKSKAKMEALTACLTPEERHDAAHAAPEAPLSEAAVDAIAALEALDVPSAQARKAVARALEVLGLDASAQALVKEGLRHRRAV